MQGQTPAPPQPPVIIQVPQPGGGIASITTSGDPSAVYEAFRNQRTELMRQLERLQNQRSQISEELQDPMVSGANRQGLEQRITQIDARITDVEKQIASADADVARAAAVPGAVVIPVEPRRPGPPDEVYVLTGIFMFVVLFPLAIGYARRLWRRGAAAVMTIPQELYDRFTRLDQAMDAVAIEVERIGESQRFLTRLHADQAALGPGAAERVASPVAERESERGRR